MVRTKIIPDSQKVFFEIPKEYVGKELEIIAFTKEEDISAKPISYKKPSDYFGTLSVQEGEELQNYLKQSRDEWERNSL